jgi:hypothetical protein
MKMAKDEVIEAMSVRLAQGKNIIEVKNWIELKKVASIMGAEPIILVKNVKHIDEHGNPMLDATGRPIPDHDIYYVFTPLSIYIYSAPPKVIER